MAASTATAVGYFPWFLVFNYLNARLKIPAAASAKLLRSAGIGLAASVTSDLCTNSIRVLKTTKQAAAAYDKEVTYRGAAALVIEADGWGVRVRCVYCGHKCWHDTTALLWGNRRLETFVLILHRPSWFPCMSF